MAAAGRRNERRFADDMREPWPDGGFGSFIRKNRRSVTSASKQAVLRFSGKRVFLKRVVMTAVSAVEESDPVCATRPAPESDRVELITLPIAELLLEQPRYHLGSCR